jgi:hypothetical protein
MSSYYESFLKPCPYCGGKIEDGSYDRRIRFICKSCDYIKHYPGLIQSNVSPVPIPYSDGKGGTLDPSLVKNQEYYHRDAPEDAIEDFNMWVDKENLQVSRNEKLNQLIDESSL